MILHAVKRQSKFTFRTVVTTCRKSLRSQSSNHTMAASRKMKLIIDTDPGIDDAMAIAAAFKWPNVEVLALTSVKGNVPCWQSTKNLLKIRKVFGKEDVPVYKGAEKAVFALKECHADYWHGIDGLHDVTDYITVDETQVGEQYAANKIIDIAKENKGEVILLAIGPLTNLALAVRLEPQLPKFLKELVILGGNYTGLGNHTKTAEFNFVADPLAAHIVLEEYTCPKYVIPWETVIDSPFSKGFVDRYISQDNERSKFFKVIIDAHCKKHTVALTDSADALAACLAVDRENVVLEELHTYASIEPFGQKTHGMMVVERRKNAHRKYDYHQPNVFIITEINMERVEEIIMNSVL